MFFGFLWHSLITAFSPHCTVGYWKSSIFEQIIGKYKKLQLLQTAKSARLAFLFLFTPFCLFSSRFILWLSFHSGHQEMSSSWEGVLSDSSPSYQGARPEDLAGEAVVRGFHPWCSGCWAEGSWAGPISQCWMWKQPSQQQHSLPSPFLSFCPTGEASLILHGGSLCLPFQLPPTAGRALGPLLGGVKFSCFCCNRTCHHSRGHPVQQPAHNRISAGLLRPGCSRL